MSDPVALVDTGDSTRGQNEAKRVGTSAVGNERALKVDVVQSVNPAGGASGPQTGTESNVGGSGTTVTLLAANTNRVTASVFNDSTAALYICAGAGASTSNFSVKVLPGGYFEVPSGYRGILTGVWDSATGNARVTEYT